MNTKFELVNNNPRGKITYYTKLLILINNI